jgi:hypothetical protein
MGDDGITLSAAAPFCAERTSLVHNSLHPLNPLSDPVRSAAAPTGVLTMEMMESIHCGQSIARQSNGYLPCSSPLLAASCSCCSGLSTRPPSLL